MGKSKPADPDKERRTSNRANSFGNVQAQQRIDAALKRKAVATKAAATMSHSVVSETLASPAMTAPYKNYCKFSPLGDFANDGDAGGAGLSARRSARERTASRKYAGEEEEAAAAAGGASPMDVDGAGPSTSRAPQRERDSWEANGHTMVDVLRGLVGYHATLPKLVQEGLMHLVLNADSHKTDLSLRALMLLMQMLQEHPPTELGEEAGVLVVNQNLWDPVTGSWQSDPLLGWPKPSRLRRLDGVAELFRSAGALLAAAVPQLPHTDTGDASDTPLGDVLLLRYWLALLQKDLDVRLGYVRASGYAPATAGQLENSLVVRLMQTHPSWAVGGKPEFVRLLGQMVVYGHMAVTHGSVVPALACAHPVVTPGELSALACQMLNMLCDAYTALERMGKYVRTGTLGAENDMVRVELLLLGAVRKDKEYKQPEHLQVLLLSLRPATATRLLVAALAEAADKRAEGSRGASDGGSLGGRLKVAADWYLGQGLTATPQILASDALRYLLDQWDWALKRSAILATGMQAKEALGLYLTALTTSALRACKEAEQEATAAPAGGGGGGSGASSPGEAAAGPAGGTAAAQAARAERQLTAALYREASERMARDGVCAGGGSGFAWISKRCTDAMAAAVA